MTIEPSAAAVDPEQLIAACQLVRAAGYVVVTKLEAEHDHRSLEYAWAENRQLRDQHQRLLWQVIGLTERCGRLLNGSRPRWFRDARSFLARYEYLEPLVFGPRGEQQ